MNSSDSTDKQGESHGPSVIASSKLRPGDILLHYRSSRKLQTKLIEAATNSPYTHASIYLGEGHVAEASPPKVRKVTLEDAIEADSHIAVFRSQCGFDSARVSTLNSFIDELTDKSTWYDIRIIAGFNKRRQQHVDNQLEKLADYFSKNAPPNDYVNRVYFCSALVVACYCVVGIIDSSATTIYTPDIYSPGALAEDPTFGHIVGYLADVGYQIPLNDPFINRTNFKKIFNAEWI